MALTIHRHRILITQNNLVIQHVFFLTHRQSEGCSTIDPRIQTILGSKSLVIRRAQMHAEGTPEAQYFALDENQDAEPRAQMAYTGCMLSVGP